MVRADRSNNTSHVLLDLAELNHSLLAHLICYFRTNLLVFTVNFVLKIRFLAALIVKNNPPTGGLFSEVSRCCVF